MSDAMPNIEGIQTEAKRTFSLKDRLQNVRARQDKVLVFTDAEAAEEVAKLQTKIILAQRDINSADLEAADIENTAAQKKEIAGRKKAAQQSLASLQDEIENAKSIMLESSLAVHITALPKVATDVARREARNSAKQKDSQIDEQVFSTEFSKALLGRAIFKIVDSSGAESDDIDIDDLYELLPSTQWDRLDKAYAEIQFTDSIAEATTDDPGF